MFTFDQSNSPLIQSGYCVYGSYSNRFTLHWRQNDHDGVSNHQPHGCLLNRLFRHRSKITSKLRVTGLCAGNSPGTGEFPAQMASNAENASVWWRHHIMLGNMHRVTMKYIDNTSKESTKNDDIPTKFLQNVYFIAGASYTRYVLPNHRQSTLVQQLPWGKQQKTIKTTHHWPFVR